MSRATQTRLPLPKVNDPLEADPPVPVPEADSGANRPVAADVRKSAAQIMAYSRWRKHHQARRSAQQLVLAAFEEIMPDDIVQSVQAENS